MSRHLGHGFVLVARSWGLLSITFFFLRTHRICVCAFYLTTKREEEGCTDMIIPTWLDGLGGPCHSEPTPPQNRELIPLRQARSRVSQRMSPPSASTLHEPYPMARAGQAAKRRRPKLAHSYNTNSWRQLGAARAGEATLEWGEVPVVFRSAHCQNRGAAR